MEIVFAKLIVSIFIIVGLSLIAEHASPKISGVLAGYPLGAAITLFFMGYEISPEFAASSATYTLLGLVSTQFFVLIYYLVSKRISRFSTLISSICAICGFLISSYVLHTIPINEKFILPLTISVTILFAYLFKHIEDVKIHHKAKLSLSVILLRGIMATAFILLITGTSSLVGEKWAGLFASFPTTLFPLMIIIHLSYKKEHVHTIIKNLPSGLGSLIVYTVMVHFLYPTYGLYLGTMLAFLAATTYLILFLNAPLVFKYLRRKLY